MDLVKLVSCKGKYPIYAQLHSFNYKYLVQLIVSVPAINTVGLECWQVDIGTRIICDLKY